MEYAPLGSTGVEVSRVCLGTVFRSEPNDATCIATIERATDLGCNFLDCANIYRDGVSEKIVGKAIKGRRDQFIVTTKVGTPPVQDPKRGGLRKESILWNAEQSLKRLNTDYIDLYLCHFPDPDAPIEDTIDAMDTLVRQGKVRYPGCSNFESWRISEALAVSGQKQQARFQCNQGQYNLLARRLEDEVIPFCEARNVAVTAYAPTQIALLTGAFRYGQAPPVGTPWHTGPYNYHDAMTPVVDKIVQTLIDVGQRLGKTPTQVAIRWCLQQGVTAVIPGTSSPDRIDENFDVTDWSIDEQDMELLNRVSERHRMVIRKDCPNGYQAES